MSDEDGREGPVGRTGLDDEQVRALFPRALDDELDPEQRAQLNQVLAARPALAAELASLRRVMHATRELAETAPSVDLLGSVQSKLRSRSGGRFYRDRFAERRGRGAMLPWAVAASVLVVLVTLVWFGLESGLLAR